jgi:hypothetical protein
MFLRTYRVAGLIAALTLSAILAVPTLSLAQNRGRGGSGRGGSSGHSSQARSGQATRRTFSRASTTRSRTTTTRSSGAYAGRTRTTTTRMGSPYAGRARSFTPSTRGSYSGGSRYNMSSSRQQAFAGQRQSASSWRGSHPSWNGNYYYNNGNYYYDSSFGYPAIMTNEWSGIAALSGGVALVGALSDDPTLFFAGSVGAFFSISLYNSDEYGNPTQRLRYAYFNRPFFWRNGVRFNRESVTRNGQRGYEFRRQ